METAQHLTPKQKHFCDEYLRDRNSSRAALAAGYSASTALNGQLMQMAKIKLYLQEMTEAAAKRVQISHDMLLRELGKIAFANVGNLFLADGKLKPLNEISADETAAIHSITIAKDGSVKIRMNSKLAALDKLARHLNFYSTAPRQPERVYVYLDKEHMTEGDWFDDEKLQAELRAEKELKRKQEARIKRQEEKRRKQEIEDAKEPQIEEGDFAPSPGFDTDEQNGLLCDSAGIPYNEKKDLFKLDLNETPAQLIARMKTYDGGDKKAAVAKVAVATPVVDAPVIVDFDGGYRETTVHKPTGGGNLTFIKTTIYNHPRVV